MQQAASSKRRLLFAAIGAVLILALAVIGYFVAKQFLSRPDYSDIFYTHASDWRRSLDIYLPEDGLPAPVLMLLHGSLGNKIDFQDTAKRLTENGYAVVLPNYRIEPVNYEDAFCALAWIHTSGEAYGLDTEHVYAIGWSSGGGIVAEMIAVNNPNDLLDGCPHEAPLQWLDGAVLLAAGSERWQESGWRTDMQPVTWIDGNEAALLLIHGEQDDLVPVEDSIQLASILEDSGDDVELLLLPEATHFFPVAGNTGYDDMLQAILDFLEAI